MSDVLYVSLFHTPPDPYSVNQVLETDYEVPTWVAVVLMLGFTASLGYGLVVGSIALPIAIWAGLLRLGLGLFLIYLFYRFVLAVETIAEKI